MQSSLCSSDASRSPFVPNTFLPTSPRQIVKRTPYPDERQQSLHTAIASTSGTINLPLPYDYQRRRSMPLAESLTRSLALPWFSALAHPMRSKPSSRGSSHSSAYVHMPEPRRLPTRPDFLQQSFKFTSASKRDQTLIERPSLRRPWSRIPKNSSTVSSPSITVSSLGPMTPLGDGDTPSGWDNLVHARMESPSALVSGLWRDDPWLDRWEPPPVNLASDQMLRRVGSKIPGEGKDSVPVDAGQGVSEIGHGQRVYSLSSPSLHMSRPRRIPARPGFPKHFTSPESPLRGRGFGDSVLVEDEDDGPLAGSSVPTMDIRDQTMIANSSLPSPFSLMSPNFSVSRSPTHPAQVQRRPPTPAQQVSPPALVAAAAEDESSTRQSSATRRDFMGLNTAAQARSLTSYPQDHDNGRLHWDYPPEQTSTGRQDRLLTHELNPIDFEDDEIHPSTTRFQYRNDPHMRPPARPRREGVSSAAMFTNAQVSISGGTFHNTVHIHEHDSPPPRGGPSLPVEAPGVQEYSLGRARAPRNVTANMRYNPYRRPRQLSSPQSNVHPSSSC